MAYEIWLKSGALAPSSLTWAPSHSCTVDGLDKPSQSPLPSLVPPRQRRRRCCSCSSMGLGRPGGAECWTASACAWRGRRRACGGARSCTSCSEYRLASDPTASQSPSVRPSDRHFLRPSVCLFYMSRFAAPSVPPSPVPPSPVPPSPVLRPCLLSPLCLPPPPPPSMSFL